jgi:CheY-like chemotaxis protein
MQSFANPPATSILAPSILICEDSAVVRIYVKRTLASAFPEARIHEAADGKAGLDVMKANKVDLIVTDLQMEGMDGDSFLRLIKRNAVLGKKPVVVLSGMITEEIRAEYAGRPEVVFLAKPATSEQLSSVVNGLLGVAS